MKAHTIHTTKAGDKFLRTHIVNSTPWAMNAYRPPARKLPGDKASHIFTMFAALAGVVGILAIVTFISK